MLFNGRPLTLDGVVGDAPAILEAWFPGVQAGNAVADVVFGKVNPGGKLPVSFPRRVGQVPIYYNHEPTGRPCDATSKYNSRHRDINELRPAVRVRLRPQLQQVRDLEPAAVAHDGVLEREAHGLRRRTNVAGPAGDEVVQLYLHDPVASISQPVRRLRGFERVTLAPGRAKTVTFTIDRSDFGFYDNAGKFVVEPGRIDLYAGNSSKATLTKSFTVTGAERSHRGLRVRLLVRAGGPQHQGVGVPGPDDLQAGREPREVKPHGTVAAGCWVRLNG